MRFRKKPAVVEARQWHGDNFEEFWKWGGGIGHPTRDAKILLWGDGNGENARFLCIETPEGDMKASPGDWIIRGVRGEFYPCKPDVFEATYEPVSDEETP